MTGVRWRQQWVAALVAIVSVVAAAACATDGKGARSPAGTASLETALVVAAAADSSRSEMPGANVATGFGNVNAPVFETLVALSPDFTVEPLLATSWELVEPNTWRFHLRPGVTFHDGAAFDAAAVADNVSRLWAEYPIKLTGLDAGSATVVDPLTVDLTPIRPNRRLVEQLVHPVYAVHAPGTFAGAGTAPGNTPTGTGPFRFARYQKDVQLEVVRNDGYWGPAARSERITFRFVEDDTDRVLALRAGEVDAIYDLPRELASTVADTPDMVVVKSAPGGYDALLLNLHGAPPHDILRDLAVRQAVAHAVDRAAIVEQVWKGNAEVMSSIIPGPVLGAHSSLVQGYPHDPAAAARLLDQAGWVLGSDGIRTRDGRRLELALVVADEELQRPAPELVQAQLKEVGIAVTIDVPIDADAYFEKLEGGDGDLFAEVGSQNDGDPSFLGALFTAEAGGFADYARLFGAGPDYGERFVRARASPDTEEVRLLAAEGMHIAVDTVVAVVPLAGINRLWALRANVEGFVPHPSDVHQRWDDVYVTT